MKNKIIVLIMFMLTVMGSSCKDNATDRQVVKNVDLNRYIGVWYEIARFPHSFEKGIVGATATYSLRPDGRINVLNQGFKGTLQGKPTKAKAKAKMPDPSQPGKLKVYFVPFFGGDYWVLDLDQGNYQWVIVGSSSMNYLWIMGRQPQMDDNQYNLLVDKARSMGYDISKLYKVPQPLAAPSL